MIYFDLTINPKIFPKFSHIFIDLAGVWGVCIFTPNKCLVRTIGVKLSELHWSLQFAQNIQETNSDWPHRPIQNSLNNNEWQPHFLLLFVHHFFMLYSIKEKKKNSCCKINGQQNIKFEQWHFFYMLNNSLTYKFTC